MSSAPPQAAIDTGELAETGIRAHHGHRARWVIAAAVLVAAAVAGGVLAATDPFSAGRANSAGVQDNGASTSLATVTRRSLSSQTPVSGTLGYAGSYSVINQAQGILTALPAVGQVVSQGQSLYSVNGSAVVLLYGSTPAYRTLSAGMTGADVAELNADLVALGDATSSQLDPSSDVFSSATTAAVEKLQGTLGLPQNGTIPLGQAVFLASAVRVTTVSGSLGGSAPTGQAVLHGSSTTRQVSVALDAAQQSEVQVGDHVTITLPDNSTTPGVVTSVGTVATTPSSGQGNSTPTVTVEVAPTDPAATGSLDQAPVEVSITTGTVNNALVVPVSALLALASGGYAVEVVDPSGVHSLVPVSVGLFDDANSLVQVSGQGLSAGQHVVVPAT